MDTCILYILNATTAERVICVCTLPPFYILLSVITGIFYRSQQHCQHDQGPLSAMAYDILQTDKRHLGRAM